VLDYEYFDWIAYLELLRERLEREVHRELQQRLMDISRECYEEIIRRNSGLTPSADSGYGTQRSEQNRSPEQGDDQQPPESRLESPSQTATPSQVPTPPGSFPSHLNPGLVPPQSLQQTQDIEANTQGLHHQQDPFLGSTSLDMLLSSATPESPSGPHEFGLNLENFDYPIDPPVFEFSSYLNN
jgi:hypothetical protein